jgi:hypothetical protein
MNGKGDQLSERMLDFVVAVVKIVDALPSARSFVPSLGKALVRPKKENTMTNDQLSMFNGHAY